MSDGVQRPEDAYAFVAENTVVDFFSASDPIAVSGEEVTWYDASGHINLSDAEWFVTAPGCVRRSGDSLSGRPAS